MALADLSPLPSQLPTPCTNSRQPSWQTVLHEPADDTRSYDVDHVGQTDLDSLLGSGHAERIEAPTTLNHTAVQGPPPEGTFEIYNPPLLPSYTPTNSTKSRENPKVPPAGSRSPFGKWMKSITRRASRTKAAARFHDQATVQTPPQNETVEEFPYHKGQHRKSSSASSFRFVSAIRNASISLASASVVAHTRRTVRSSRLSRTDRNNRTSLSGYRISEDNTSLDGIGYFDTAAAAHSLQRRKILEELISTEESYIGDIRLLTSVYVNILAALPDLPENLRGSINQNLAEMIRLHDEVLGELHRVIPSSEYTQLDFPPPFLKSDACDSTHCRGLSLDGLPDYRTSMQWLQSVPGMVADPQVAAEVAKIFSKRMHRFFIYKEYGAKYEMMIKDIASTDMTLPGWESYQMGLETLAGSTGPRDTLDGSFKRSLTIGDLLVKPIQRVCRYPLLFAELLKCTTITDCPNSHMEIETTLMRLREATAEINRATTDDGLRVTLEKTWSLQDRLVFPERKIDAFSKNEIRSYGHIQLCGALYICWQTEEEIEGMYMICLLYNDVLCLASAGKVEQIYTIQACINLHQARVEDVDNGRGLQCRTAPFSWKLVFEADLQMYELIMVACTPQEEAAWRCRLNRNNSIEPGAIHPDLHGFLSLELKSLGAIFGGPGTIARRMSIHRATTIGYKTPLRQVILKNTSKIKPSTGSPLPIAALNRSQSMLISGSRTPVLAPPRSERARLEILLIDVWTLDILPLPGMTSIARNEQMVRRSASTIIRKLSITGSLGKRAGSIRRLRERNGSNGCPALVAANDSSEDDPDLPEVEDWEGRRRGSRLRSSTLPPTIIRTDEEDSWAPTPDLAGHRSMEALTNITGLEIPKPLSGPGTTGLPNDPGVLRAATHGPWTNLISVFDRSTIGSGIERKTESEVVRSQSPRWLRIGSKRRIKQGHGHEHGIRHLFH